MSTHYTRVKICGITTLEDARFAAQTGADYLGFNLYPKSPRYIATAAIRNILDEIRREGYTAAGVGIFVNVPAEQAQAILDATGLRYAQFHGDEGPVIVAQLSPWAFKAIRPQNKDDALQLAAEFHCTTGDDGPGLLIDAYSPHAYGGTGHRTDDQLATPVVGQYARTLLAGGLNPHNVAQAVSAVRPWGVDVSSGVESAPGKKDPAKVAAFIQAARAGDGE